MQSETIENAVNQLGLTLMRAYEQDSTTSTIVLLIKPGNSNRAGVNVFVNGALQNEPMSIATAVMALKDAVLDSISRRARAAVASAVHIRGTSGAISRASEGD